MVFSSTVFLFYFLPAALALYHACPRRLKHLVLTGLSYLFYGWANPLFVVVLLTSTCIDYVVARVIARRVTPSGSGAPGRGADGGLPAPVGPRPRAARAALAVSIFSNLALLGFFKYFNFGTASIDALADAVGLSVLRLDVALRVTLPLGISFYTFQSMSYTIDVFRGRVAPTRNFVDFACYVSMFPQLVAGPIIRFSEIAGQLRSRTHSAAKFARGVAFFSLGMAKKVLLANPCGWVADVTFGADSRGALEAWYGVTAYAFQIYFDFSGYSDMAIGLGLMLGFVFPKNFDSPYRSGSITEFWHRWHISLSTWLRDYLYLPIGGNRRGPRRTFVNLFVVMLLGGLWHGAAWNFVVWGGLHGVLLAIERLRGKAALYDRWPAPLRVATTFVMVLITWVFFRAPDLGAALRYLGSMAGVGGSQPAAGLLADLVYRPYYVMTFAIAGLVVWGAPQTWDWTRTLTPARAALSLLALLLSIGVLSTQAYNPFIYFIF